MSDNFTPPTIHNVTPQMFLDAVASLKAHDFTVVGVDWDHNDHEGASDIDLEIQVELSSGDLDDNFIAVAAHAPSLGVVISGIPELNEDDEDVTDMQMSFADAIEVIYFSYMGAVVELLVEAADRTAKLMTDLALAADKDAATGVLMAHGLLAHIEGATTTDGIEYVVVVFESDDDESDGDPTFTATSAEDHIFKGQE